MNLIGVEEQLLDPGQEFGLIQAQVVPPDLEDKPVNWRLGSSSSPVLEAGSLVVLVESEAEPWDAVAVSSSLYCTVLLTYVTFKMKK